MNNWNTKTMPRAVIGTAFTVEVMAEVLALEDGKAALLLLAVLSWKRKNGPHVWVAVTNGEWKKRTGMDRRSKYRGAGALEAAGLVTVLQEGKHSKQFKLADRVDPRMARKSQKKKKPVVVDMATGNAIASEMAKNRSAI